MEKKLERLLANLSPEMKQGDYVFCTSKELPANINLMDIRCFFKEKEGYSMVIQKEIAEEHNLDFDLITSWIELGVYSSLSAIGLTARVANALTEEGISCNCIAAYHHDHLFIDKESAPCALDILQRLSKQN